VKRMLDQELSALREQIRSAFPPAPFYGPVTDCNCAECADIATELQRQRWDDVPAKFIDFTCSPVLLGPAAFQAFLPAYLLRALDDLSQHSVVVEFTVYCLCPDVGDETEVDRDFQQAKLNLLRERAAKMTPAQTEAIRSFLKFVKDNAGDGEWLGRFISPCRMSGSYDNLL
jgi:hypothetical protein